MVFDSGESSENNEEGSGGVGWGDIYKRSTKPVLVLLSDSYLLLESISAGISRPSSCLISYYLLTTSTTDYYLKENVNNFNLRRLFYSK